MKSHASDPTNERTITVGHKPDIAVMIVLLKFCTLIRRAKSTSAALGLHTRLHTRESVVLAPPIREQMYTAAVMIPYVAIKRDN